MSEEHRWKPDEYVANWQHSVGVISQFFPILVENANLKVGQRVLDLGCASGKWAIAFAMFGCDTVAVDFMPEMLDRVRLNFPVLHRAIWLIEDDARTLNTLPDHSLDMIESEGLYEHFLDIEERKKMVVNWVWKLNHTGVCVVMVPKFNNAEDEVKFETVDELVAELASFKVFKHIKGATFNRSDGKGILMAICHKEKVE